MSFLAVQTSQITSSCVKSIVLYLLLNQVLIRFLSLFEYKFFNQMNSHLLLMISVVIVWNLSGLLQSQIKKPIGKSPLTLSKVFPGTIKIFSSFARKHSLNCSKFADCRIFNFENSAILQLGISL